MEGMQVLIPITAIIAGCIMLTLLFKYGAQVVRDVFGTPSASAAEGASLEASEVESMIRRAVREEVRPLEEKIERLERRDQRQEPSGELLEDPHDFGLIADASDVAGERLG